MTRVSVSDKKQTKEINMNSHLKVEGVKGRVVVQAFSGGAVKFEADKVTMKKTDLSANGGSIGSNTKSLCQIGNRMQATNKGKIINEAEQELVQVDNEMFVDRGTIKNVQGKEYGVARKVEPIVRGLSEGVTTSVIKTIIKE